VYGYISSICAKKKDSIVTMETYVIRCVGLVMLIVESARGSKGVDLSPAFQSK